MNICIYTNNVILKLRQTSHNKVYFYQETNFTENKKGIIIAIDLFGFDFYVKEKLFG